MTEMLSAEYKLIYFAILFSVVTAFFVGLYNSDPIQTSTTIDTSELSWFERLISDLPAPFNDTGTLIIFSIFISVIGIMLLLTTIRFLRDLLRL